MTHWALRCSFGLGTALTRIFAVALVALAVRRAGILFT
jgi:hypothetical protein